ncbi:MAG TPA: PQQ-binding-like beta-propeller repeat protein [Pirellulales bacterium]|nr:PQQ-binding-like beta-propeller repeat protein [Pirellulales bacterium]
MTPRIASVVLGLGLLLAAGAATAAETWSQWRGANRDGVALEAAPRKAWPQELLPAWQIEVGLGHSSPIVAGDKVYIFTRQDDKEVVRAVSHADGKEIWVHGYAAPFEVSPPAAGHGKGPKSTPVVADGRLFTLGISGILSCWDAVSGELKWRKEFSKQFKHTSPLYGTAMSPLVDRGRLIVHVGGHDAGALVALDVADGEVAWTWDGDGPAYCSPIVAELSGTRQIITQTQSACVGIAADNGELLWKIPYKTEFDQNSVTPVVYEQSVICSGYNRGIDRYRIEKQGDEWLTDKIWENKEVSLYMSSPVTSGQRLFGFSHRQKGQLFALDITTGRTLWTSEGRMADNVALVRTGDVLWALTTQADLLLFRDSDKQFEQVARYKVAETPTWAHPVIAAGSVIVKDETKLTKWKFQAPAAPAAAGSVRAVLSGGPRG